MSYLFLGSRHWLDLGIDLRRFVYVAVFPRELHARSQSLAIWLLVICLIFRLLAGHAIDEQT